MINAAETATQPTPTDSTELPAADSPPAAGSSADETTVSPEVTTQLEKRPAKRSEHGFTPARLERIIAALAKLIEAFAALSRARRDQQAEQPKLEAPKDPAVAVPEPAPEGADSDAISAPIVPSPQAEIPAPTEQQPSAPTQQPSLSQPAAQREAPGSAAALEPPAVKARQPVRRGHALGNSSGFLWKPKSDKNGKLAILLPPHLTGKVADVAILSPDGMRTLQRGHYSGSGNGEREHFRFSKPGGDFPDGSIVVIMLKDGSRQHLTIKETSARVQK